MAYSIALFIITKSTDQRAAIKSSLANNNLVSISGEAGSVSEALVMATRIRSDVTLLDMQMLPVDDKNFLRQFVIRHPHPIIVLSDRPENDFGSCFEALKNGAVDIIFRDELGPNNSKELTERIICASRLEVCPDTSLVDNTSETPPPAKRAAEIIFCEDCGARNIFEDPMNGDKEQLRCLQCGDLLEPHVITQYKRTHYVTIIVAGTGSYPNLLKIIPRVPSEISGAIIIAISDESPHVDAFTNYLSSISAVKIHRLKTGMSIEGGNCYVTTFNDGLQMKPFSTRNTMEKVGEMSGQNSVDLLMESIVAVFKTNTAGLFLSGSGLDGENGLKNISRHGGISAVLFSLNCLHRQMGENILRRCKVDKIVDENNAHKFITELHDAARESLSAA